MEILFFSADKVHGISTILEILYRTKSFHFSSFIITHCSLSPTRPPSGHVAASNQCKLCRKSYSLGQKESRSIMSDWTKLISSKMCLMYHTKTTDIGKVIHKYFQIPVCIIHFYPLYLQPLPLLLTWLHRMVDIVHKSTVMSNAGLSIESPLYKPEMLLHIPLS